MVFGPGWKPGEERHGTTTGDPEAHAVRQVPSVRAPRAAGPDLAGQEAHEGAALVLGRPPGRQPGPHRSDGPRPQAPHVRGPREDGLQGDRGRVPVGLAARLRLRAPPHRGGPGPRGRDDPGARAVPARADPPDLRVPPGRPPGHRPLLQLDVDPPAAGRLRPRQGRASSTSRSTRRGSAGSSRRRSRDTRDLLRVLARELHGHRGRVRRRDLRSGHGRHRADARAEDRPEPARHRGDVHAEPLRRHDRVVPAEDLPAGPRRAVAPPAQRPRLRGRRDRARRAGGGRPGRGHALRERRADRATSTWSPWR